MKYIESEHQQGFMKWVKLSILRYPILELLYCNHNTQSLSRIQAARWKSLGGKAGIPDMFFPVPANGFHGLYIEFKSPDRKPKRSTSKGGLSDEQIRIFNLLREEGYQVSICYSMYEAIDVMKDYLTRYYLFKEKK